MGHITAPGSGGSQSASSVLGYLPNAVTKYGLDNTGATYNDALLISALAAESGLFFPAGTYKFAHPIHIHGPKTLVGVNGYISASFNGTIFAFDDSIPGIIGDYQSSAGVDSQGSEIRNILFSAAAQTTTGAHGIELRRAVALEIVNVNGFSEAGITWTCQSQGESVTASTIAGSNILHLSAPPILPTNAYIGGFVTLAAAAGTWPFLATLGVTITSWVDSTHAVLSCSGAQVTATVTNGTFILNGSFNSGVNSNQSICDLGRLTTVTSTNNRSDGITAGTGGDTSAWTIIGADCRSNGGWGVNDQSFLGCTWVGCHVAANQGGYSAPNATAFNCAFVNCYEEGGQPNKNAIALPATILGGDRGDVNTGSAIELGSALVNANGLTKVTPGASSFFVPYGVPICEVDCSAAAGDVSASFSLPTGYSYRVRLVKVDAGANKLKVAGTVITPTGSQVAPVVASTQYQWADILVHSDGTIIWLGFAADIPGLPLATPVTSSPTTLTATGTLTAFGTGIVVVAPLSGNVLCKANFLGIAASNSALQVQMMSGGIGVGPSMNALFVNGTEVDVRTIAPLLVTGLTAGTVYTLTLGCKLGSGTTALAAGPLTLEALTA